jgi:hypothetical protein
MEKSIKNDFDDLLQYTISKGLIKKDVANKIIDELKRIHKIAFAVAIWDDAVSNLEDNQKSFIKSIRSDIVQSIPLVFAGHINATALSLRLCIENILKHIYYFDHPIEYQRLIISRNHFLTFKEFLDYLKFHPIIEKAVEDTDILCNFSNKYSELSELVHGTTLHKNSIAECLANIKFSMEYFEDYFRVINLIGKYVVFLLCILHYELYKTFPNPTRRTMMNILDKDLKRKFHDISSRLY